MEANSRALARLREEVANTLEIGEVRSALTGTAGIQLVEEQCPDVVVVDLKLPGMDGDEVLTKIRRLHPGRRRLGA